MNTRPIELAHDADLRSTLAAIKRSALRAREVAIQTGTRLVIHCDGVIQTLEPEQIERMERTALPHVHPAAAVLSRLRPGAS